MTDIRPADTNDISVLYDLYHALNKSDDGYFEHAFERGHMVYIVEVENRPAGFCLLNFEPRYNLFRRMDIPEIQDLNILSAHRRKGYGTALIKWCEGVARAKGKSMIGISVGLTKDYGPAQILYTKLGYIPDGNGVTYDRDGVNPHQPYPMDDHLSLMMVKPL